VAMVVYLFYFSGKLWKTLNFKNITKRKKWLLVAMPFILHLSIAHYAPTPSFYYGEYGILPLTYIMGLLGFIWLFFLLKLLPAWRPIVWTGQNTLPILALHVLAMTVIKAVALFVFNIEIVFNFWSSLGLALLQILILVPVILVLNKHFPILIGRENQKKDLKMNPDKAN
jgi:acyltransferase